MGEKGDGITHALWVSTIGKEKGEEGSCTLTVGCKGGRRGSGLYAFIVDYKRDGCELLLLTIGEEGGVAHALMLSLVYSS